MSVVENASVGWGSYHGIRERGEECGHFERTDTRKAIRIQDYTDMDEYVMVLENKSLNCRKKLEAKIIRSALSAGISLLCIHPKEIGEDQIALLGRSLDTPKVHIDRHIESILEVGGFSVEAEFTT